MNEFTTFNKIEMGILFEMLYTEEDNTLYHSDGTTGPTKPDEMTDEEWSAFISKITP
jgi:hypothetical protein